MSKFIEKLKRLSEGMPQPMGFGRAQAAASKPKIQLIACFDNANVDAASTADADAAFVRVSDQTASKDALKDLSEKSKLPWGILVTADAQPGVFGDTGADFVVFPGSMPIKPLLDTKLGKIIEVDITASDTSLRMLNALPVDAILVRNDSQTGALTWNDLATIHRIGALLSKPVILPVPAGISKAELQAIWEAKIDGFMVSCSADPRAELKQLRELVNQLEYPKPVKQDRPTAIAPRPSVGPEHHDEHDDEEEDE